MPIVPRILDDDADAEVRKVYDDIRATRGTDYINDFWRVLANDPPQLDAVWRQAKSVMAPGAIDALMKELIYVAVSIANNCEYCVKTHTAAARAKGMTDEQYREFMRVVALASVTNRIAIGYQIEPDERYRTPAS
ncbi:MAG: carboxymuconolactone decarboxylase family protein [Burkholderiaceae bacterium]